MCIYNRQQFDDKLAIFNRFKVLKFEFAKPLVVQNHKMASFGSQNIIKIDVFKPQIWLKLTFCRFFEREFFKSNTPEL